MLGKRNPTTRDFMEVSHRGTFRDHPRFVGSPKDVADGMEEWFAGRACDGFVVAASHVPGTYEDFARLITPELQRRGLLHKDYRWHHVARESGTGSAGDRRLAAGAVKPSPASHCGDPTGRRLTGRDSEQRDRIAANDRRPAGSTGQALKDLDGCPDGSCRC